MRGRDPWPRFMAPVHCSLFDFLFVFMGAYGWLARGSINARDGQDTERALVCVGERSHGDDKRERAREENGTSFSPNPDDFDPPFDSPSRVTRTENGRKQKCDKSWRAEGQFKKPPLGKGFPDPLRNVALNVRVN